MTSKLLTVGDVIDFIPGHPFNSEFFNTNSSGVPLIRIRDVVRGRTETYFDGEVPETAMVRSGDFLIGMDGDFRIKAWPGPDAALNQRILKLGNTKESTLRGYMALWLEPKLLEIWENTSFTTVKHLSAKTIKALPINLPSLPEQRRIVDLIGALDDAIEAAEGKHQAAISVVDQMANSLAGEKVALAKLLTTIDAGKSPSGVERAPLSGERAVLKVSAIGPNGFLPAEAKVVAPEVSLRDETRIKKDDVLLVRANGVISRVGATCIVKEEHPELYLCDKTLRLVPDRSRIMPHWLNMAMKSADVRSQIESLTGGSDMRNITQKSILKIEIPKPDMAIQGTFADAFRSLDESIELTEKHIANLSLLRTEILTALLSGAHEIPESYDSVMELASA